MFFSHRTLAAFSTVLTSLHAETSQSSARSAAFISALRGLFANCEVALIRSTKPARRRSRSTVSRCNHWLAFPLAAARQQVIVQRREPFTAGERHLAARIREHAARLGPQMRQRANPERQPSTSRSAHMPELTPREYEVLQKIMAGNRNAEISRSLGAAPRTIGKHVENILRKLRVETRGAAASMAAGRLARLRTSTGRDERAP